MKKNIVLTGFMGTGKTAVGKVLAQRLGYRLVDVDEEIELEQGMKISDIFRDRGEPAFRDVETAMIGKLAEAEGTVISTGGGAVLRQENMDILRRRGVIVCMQASAATILKRTMGSADRPLLNVPDPMAKITELLDYRRPFYEKADIVVDTEGKSPIAIAEEIMEAVKNNG